MNFPQAPSNSPKGESPNAKEQGNEIANLQGRCGWWTEIGTAPLVNALKDFLTMSEEELKAMGRNGRKLVEEKYSTKTIARQMRDMYERIRI